MWLGLRQADTEELYKKDLHDPDNHNGAITHLEPDILECEDDHIQQRYNVFKLVILKPPAPLL